MQRSIVLLPVTGFIEVVVDHADDLPEREIISEALGKADFTVEGSENVFPDHFSAHRHVTSGSARVEYTTSIDDG